MGTKTDTSSSATTPALKRRLQQVTAKEGAAREQKHDLIRLLRNDRGLSLRDVSDLTDVSHTGIARICGEAN